MCIGVWLIIDQHRFGDARSLLELAFTFVDSCSYDNSLTKLPIHKHLHLSSE